MSSSTFSGLFIAKSGVQNARNNLNIIGQNITNVNTRGYTRQRVLQSAVPSPSLGMLYSSGSVVTGEGVSSDGIEQLRDMFLDGQYRTQNAQYGDTDTALSALQNIETLFNETKIGGLGAAFRDLVKQLQGMTSSGSSTATESNVKEAAAALATKFNTLADRLNTIRDEQSGYLNQYGVDKVNLLLSNISDLNGQIKSAELAGSPALELNDQRNALIDELSQYIPVQVETTRVDVGSGRTVSNLAIYLADANGNRVQCKDPDLSAGTWGTSRDIALVDGISTGTFAFSSSGDHTELALTDASGNPCYESSCTLTLDGGTYKVSSSSCNDLIKTGSFASYLSLLNDNGEYDGDGVTQGIGYYQKMLDTLAQNLADIMNRDNSTNDNENNKPLFTNSTGGTANIKASNIRVAAAWGTDYHLTTSKGTSNTGDDNSSSYANISKMISDLQSEKYTLKADPSDASSLSLFTGTLEEAVANISNNLGIRISGLDSQNSSNSSMLNEIDTRRQSLSSVDINEETINLIIYNQALGASSRFMTTIDECLDTIINKMGLVGR